MIEQQTVCLRRLGCTRSGEVKLGRWLSNEDVTKEEIAENILEKSKSLVKGKHILAIQDTTELNYESKINRIAGIGPVGNGLNHGTYLHTMLAVDANESTCLGLTSIKTWTRSEIKKKKYGNIYRKQLIEDKESYKWIEAADKSKQILSDAVKITIVADRESDIYEEWYRIPDDRTYLITRACQDRVLCDGNKLFSYAEKLNVTGFHELEVRAQLGKRTARKAKLEIRFGIVEIKKPPKCTDNNAPPSVRLTVVDVKEHKSSALKDEEPIHWCLLTTHSIETEEDALQIINWYCQRWQIEQFFRTLQKQGLDIESSQVETVEKLMKIITIACFAALRIMQLTLSRDGNDQNISVVFSEQERKLLSRLQIKLEGKTEKQKNPHPQGKLSWAAWIIARLGGWKGYVSESPPGPITMLRGFRKFQLIYEGWSLEMCA